MVLLLAPLRSQVSAALSIHWKSGHLPHVLMDVRCLVLDGSSDTHQSSASFPLIVQSRAARLSLVGCGVYSSLNRWSKAGCIHAFNLLMPISAPTIQMQQTHQTRQHFCDLVQILLISCELYPQWHIEWSSAAVACLLQGWAAYFGRNELGPFLELFLPSGHPETVWHLVQTVFSPSERLLDICIKAQLNRFSCIPGEDF